MTKFLVHYYAPADKMAKKKDCSDAEQAEMMKAWMAWKDDCGDQMVCLGAPLQKGESVTECDKNCKSECSMCLCGFSIVQADDMEGAKALFDGHPHLEWDKDAKVVLYPFAPMPDCCEGSDKCDTGSCK